MRFHKIKSLCLVTPLALILFSYYTPKVTQKLAFGCSGISFFAADSIGHVPACGLLRRLQIWSAGVAESQLFSFLRYSGFRLPCQKTDSSICFGIRSISEEERESLEFFFRSAIAFDSFGYSLFGEKPLSVLVYSETVSSTELPLSLHSRHSCFHPFNKKIKQGWEAWEKHHRKFHLKNYALIKCKNFIDNEFSAVLLVNKRSVLKTINEHLSDFKSVLGEHITATWLLEEILHSNDVFNAVLKNHQGLIGTLLGYGRNNAWAFHVRYEAQESQKKKKDPIRILGCTPAQKKWKSLNKKLQLFTHGERLNFLFMNLPGFMADLDSEETQLLRFQYERNYKIILEQYKERDFLEITIQQLTSK